MGAETSDEPKTLEQPYSLQPFQNGRPSFAKGNAPGGRLYVQDKPKRSIFLGSNFQQTQKVSTIQMEQQDLRISVPLFWSGASPSDFYKTSESLNCNIEKIECSPDNIFR